MEVRSTALITGASGGLGASFARELAARGHDVVLVARRRERLEALAAELHKIHPVTAEVLVADLATEAGVERVELCITEMDALDMLINNAGFGIAGRFAETDLSRHVDIIRVHVLASVRLCRAALPGMIARGSGAIINVASLAAFIPLTGNVTYGATKACVVAFSERLHAELASTGVKVQALCPGYTHTEFHDAPEFAAAARIPDFVWMSAEDVVAASLRALERNRVVCIPGINNRLFGLVAGTRFAAWLLRLLHRRRE